MPEGGGGWLSVDGHADDRRGEDRRGLASNPRLGQRNDVGRIQPHPLLAASHPIAEIHERAAFPMTWR